MKTETEMPESWLMLNEWIFLVKLMNERTVGPPLLGVPLRSHSPSTDAKFEDIEICEFMVNVYEEELGDVVGTDLFL